MENGRSDEPMGHMARRRGYRSMFWPIILIGVGVVLLLGELGVVEQANWWGLIRLWPVLLILAGLDLLFARSAPIVGALLGLLLVAGVVVLLVWGGQQGWLTGEPWRIGGITILETANVKHDVYSAPLGQAESAEVELHLGALQTNVSALADSNNLIEAEIDHVADMRFEVSGTRTMRVILDEENVNIGSFAWRIGGQYRWGIGLSPEIPIDLTVDASSGHVDLQLGDLNLERLLLDASSGAVSAALPATLRDLEFVGSSGRTEFTLADETSADVVVEMSSGAFDLTVGDDVRVDVVVRRGSSGALTLTAPSGTPMRVEVRDSSSGAVRLPRELNEVERGTQDKGTWQTDDWKADGRGVTLTIDDMSSGAVTVRYR